jgi:hypothetical protein
VSGLVPKSSPRRSSSVALWSAGVRMQSLCTVAPAESSPQTRDGPCVAIEASTLDGQRAVDRKILYASIVTIIRVVDERFAFGNQIVACNRCCRCCERRPLWLGAIAARPVEPRARRQRLLYFDVPHAVSCNSIRFLGNH